MPVQSVPTAQVTELAGITSEQLRYWKKALRPIDNRDGRKRGYDFTELIAIVAIGGAMNQFKLDISRFEGAAEAFFDAVAQIIRENITPGILYLSGDQVSISTPNKDADEVSMLFEIGRIADRIRHEMTSAPALDQLSFI